MNRFIVAISLAAAGVAAVAPAQAQEPRAQSTIQVGKQCFKPTDSRGYGYWTSCEQVYAFAIRSLKVTTVDAVAEIGGGTDGGGGDGGGGGGGGGR